MFKKLLLIPLLVIRLLAVSQEKMMDKDWGVGKKCPDFNLNDIYKYGKNTFKLSDCKGKWIILDFWSKTCSACIAGFPETNKLQQEFESQVQVILVGYGEAGIPEAKSDIKKLYSRLEKKENLNLVHSYDTALFKRFGIITCPSLIVVDPNGIIRYLPTEMKVEYMREILSGKALQLASWKESDYNYKLPFLVNTSGSGNGGVDTSFLFRSILSKWHVNMPYYEYGTINGILKDSTNRVELLKADLATLYNYAYLGRRIIELGDSLYGILSMTPVLEIRDSSIFSKPDWNTGDNFFCYSLMVPFKESNGKVRKQMQSDLLSCFGYKAEVAVRKCKYWRLRCSVIAKEKLKSTNSTEKIASFGLHQGFVAQYVTMKWLIHRIYTDNQGVGAIIDETGIDRPIDITLDCNFTDWNDILLALKKSGLTLEESEKDMQVVVIKDKENTI